jgi:hypothetical protein
VTRTAGVGDPRRIQLGEAVVRSLAARRDHDARTIATALAPHARDAVIEKPRTELELYRASYLVERDAVGAFDAVMDRLAGAERDRMSFTYTGPLPAHSFVSLPARRG